MNISNWIEGIEMLLLLLLLNAKRKKDENIIIIQIFFCRTVRMKCLNWISQFSHEGPTIGCLRIPFNSHLQPLTHYNIYVQTNKR